jgi:hypothetical protein
MQGVLEMFVANPVMTTDKSSVQKYQSLSAMELYQFKLFKEQPSLSVLSTSQTLEAFSEH